MAERKLRIHNLAQELMVSSKAVMEKCCAEGIDVKNHMHVVSAGLEATIREWFSEGQHDTTVEEAAPVNLTAVRVSKPRKKTKSQLEAETKAVAQAAAVEAAAVEAEAKKAAKKAAAEAQQQQYIEDHAARVDEGEFSSEPQEQEETTVAATVHSPLPHPHPASTSHKPEVTLTTHAEGEESPAGGKGSPAKPMTAEQLAASAPAKDAAHPTKKVEEVRKAGPQNVPRPAQVTGPKVIRMGKAEDVSRPRPATRPAPRPGMGRPPVGRAGGSVPDLDERGNDRNRSAGGAQRPRRGLVDEAAAARRAHPRRTFRDDRELSYEQLKEWRERDLLEMRDRLANASGRGINELKTAESKMPQGRRERPRTTKRDKIELSEPIQIKEMARLTGIQGSMIIQRLMKDYETFANMNGYIDADKAQLIASEAGIELVIIKPKTGLEKVQEEFDAIERKHLRPRPPVVTVLGHVDHGKTSLLDRIRKTNVTAGEAGGITQHIGAYRVQVGDKWVTFLDTPGHAAFTAMRARGANMTDVVVLVVAADDGVMPTTVEAINHARAANTTIVVALNKSDLPHDINKIYGQLTEHGLTPSGDWGGDTDVVKTSATTGAGIDELLNHLATLSDVLDLKADPTIPATGIVIESERSDTIGNVARLLVQEGTLKAGQTIVCGGAHGRVRSMTDSFGKKIKQAGPSTPVEVTGLSNVPDAGDKFFVLDNAQRAKEIADEIVKINREAALIRIAKPTTLEAMLSSAAEGEIPELNVIIRADMQGSVDVIEQELLRFPSNEVKLKVLHSGVGTVTESDIVLAQASKAIIIGFHVVPDPAISRMADNVGVDIRTYRVIYNLIDDIKKALEGLLEPDEKLESRGRVEVREVFNITRVGRVAGCIVREGVIRRNNKIRVLRDNVVVKDNGTIDSLKRFKDDAKEVKAGIECGIKIVGFDDLKPGDIIEAYEVIQVARTLTPV